MTVGTSIFLIVIGAILSYAIRWELPAVDVAAVGVILMLAGVLGLAVSLAWAFHPNRRGERQDGPSRRFDQDRRFNQGRREIETFGEAPPAPRWDTYVPPTTVPPTTYTVPFDGHQDQGFADGQSLDGHRPPAVADRTPPAHPTWATGAWATGPTPVVAPWYSGEGADDVAADSDGAT